MKTNFSISIVTIVITSIMLIGCKDDKDEPKPLTPACRITKEYVVGKLDYITYAYVGDIPSKFTSINEVGNPINVLEVFSLSVSKTDVDKTHYHPYTFSINYDVDYLSVSPSSGNISYTVDNVTTTDYMTYLYRYDYKGRVVEINERTDHILTDHEYKLLIDYDEHDNVTRLHYTLTTGPRDNTTTITVSGYDDKPTPYAGVKGWRYLMSNFTWNNSDPLPVILALSKNNPGVYHFFAGDKETFQASFTYEYNEKGFPTQRNHINKNENGEYHFTTAFEYQCP